MSSSISTTTGNTFSNGDSATSTKLNNIVNSMTISSTSHNSFLAFDGSGNIVDGIASGGLSLSAGSLTISSPIAVSLGGTGTSSLATTGIVIGHSTGALTASSTLTADSSGNVTQAGNLTFATNGGGIVGAVLGASPNLGIAGYNSGVGLNSASAIILTTNTTVNVVTNTFQAGNWMVWGNVWFQVSGGTTATTFTGGISASSATLPGIDSAAESQSAAAIAAAGIQANLPITPKIFRSSISFTLYLVSASAFSAGGVSTFGGMTWLQLP